MTAESTPIPGERFTTDVAGAAHYAYEEPSPPVGRTLRLPLAEAGEDGAEIQHARHCTCGELAIVMGPPEWTADDVDAAFAEQERLFPDGASCWVCFRERRTAALEAVR